MENATKALLISASVLIVIVIIALGIRLLNSSQGVANDVDKVTTAAGLSMHNSQYTDYEGIQTGAEVKALLNKAAATHRNGSLHKVNVNTYTTANDIASFRSTIQVNSTYTVSVEYDSEGYVCKVNVR